MSEGYKALREGAALIDLSDRGKIRVTGVDRVRLIHALCTNSVEELSPGQSCYAFFLNAQGRILADSQIYCQKEQLLVDTEPATCEKLLEHIDRYIIADDVTLENISGALGEFALEGPHAEEVIGRARLPAPEEDGAFVEIEEAAVARVTATGTPGFRIIPPSGLAAALVERLVNAGAVPTSAADARTVRIENGFPRYGEELTEDYIPHETQVMRAVHFTKGCYLGQEIVERVRSRGSVNKLLVQLLIPGDIAPEPGSKLRKDDKSAGLIVSTAPLPAGRIAAMGYLRAAYVRPGTELAIEGFPQSATVSGGAGPG
jgi:aminomethyltransferase